MGNTEYVSSGEAAVLAMMPCAALVGWAGQFVLGAVLRSRRLARPWGTLALAHATGTGVAFLAAILLAAVWPMFGPIGALFVLALVLHLSGYVVGLIGVVKAYRSLGPDTRPVASEPKTPGGENVAPPVGPPGPTSERSA